MVKTGEGPAPKKPKSNTLNEVSRQAEMRYCSVYDENVLPTSYVGHLKSKGHTTRSGIVDLTEGVVVVQSAFNCRIVTYRVSPENYHINVDNFMAEIKSKILPIIEQQVTKFTSVTVHFEFFEHFILESKQLEDIKSFMTKNSVSTRGTDLNHLYRDFTGILDEKVFEFQERESGWTLKQLLYIDVNINKFNPL